MPENDGGKARTAICAVLLLFHQRRRTNCLGKRKCAVIFADVEAAADVAGDGIRHQTAVHMQTVRADFDIALRRIHDPPHVQRTALRTEGYAAVSGVQRQRGAVVIVGVRSAADVDVDLGDHTAVE